MLGGGLEEGILLTAADEEIERDVEECRGEDADLLIKKNKEHVRSASDQTHVSSHAEGHSKHIGERRAPSVFVLCDDIPGDRIDDQRTARLHDLGAPAHR